MKAHRILASGTDSNRRDDGIVAPVPMPDSAMPNIPRLLLALLLSLLVTACSKEPSLLEQVKKEGELRVLTRNAATTYYEGADGSHRGLEYELARGFAEYLGVELKMVVAGNVSEVLTQLAEGHAHLAAAGLTVTEPRQVWARFTTPYQYISQHLVYRIGTPRPRSLDDLDGILEVLTESSHAERLRHLKVEHPSLEWVENDELESEELLTLVWERVIDYTVIDSNELSMNRRFYPELRVAFDLTEPEPLAWAFPRFQDDSLFNAAQEYFAAIAADGRLEQLLERYYGHLGEFDYVGTRTYLRHIQQRLPEFRQLFEYAAKEYDLDWRLLAAMAYQESHWDPDAVSPTGVRGIMMLTRATADYLGVERRTDPTQSIMGGARYLERLLRKLPERIQEPDRTWMAVASYNVGFGHLEDARIITQRRGGDADAWKDVKENLPLLRKRKWYRQTKHGYARGNEAARYVENIRSYYEVLVWYLEQQKPEEPEPNKALEILNPVL